MMELIGPLVILTGIPVGRLLLGRWFNHLTLYSLVWGASLGLYSVKLIDYRAITLEAWAFILLAWLMLFLGSVIVLLLNPFSGDGRIAMRPAVVSSPARLAKLEKRLRFYVLLSCGLAGIAVAEQLAIDIRAFGGVGNLFLSFNRIYELRMAGDLPSGTPFIGSLWVTAACLAGIHLAVKRRFGFVSILPVLLAFAGTIALMGRIELALTLALFFLSYVSAKRTFRGGQLKAKGRRTVYTLVAVVTIVFFSIGYVSSLRGITLKFPGETGSMETLREVNAFFPPAYVDFTSPPVVFSMFLEKGGHEPFGLFAPLQHFLARIGIMENVPYYEQAYSTPVPINVGTYLKDLYGTLGPIGVLLFPLLVGGFTTWLFIYVRRRESVASLVLLSFSYLFILFSWLYALIKLGTILIGFLATIGMGMLIERKSLRARKPRVSEEGALDGGN